MKAFGRWSYERQFTFVGMWWRLVFSFFTVFRLLFKGETCLLLLFVQKYTYLLRIRRVGCAVFFSRLGDKYQLPFMMWFGCLVF